MNAVVCALQMFNLLCSVSLFLSQFSTNGRWILTTAVQPLVRAEHKACCVIVQHLEDHLTYYKCNCMYSSFVLCHLSSLSLIVCTRAAIGPDGMCCQSREFKEWHGCRSTKGVTKGVWCMQVLSYWLRFKTRPIRIRCISQGTSYLFERLTKMKRSFISFQKWHVLVHVFLCPGKYYYEMTCHDQGLCRVGWSTSQAALDLGMLFYSSQSPCSKT